MQYLFFKQGLKKSARIRYATSQFTCDYITGNPDYESAVVSFDAAMYPGQFMINDEFYEANFPFVIDDGMSRDYKYERISTGTWLFYAKIGEGQRLLQKLNKARSDFVLFSAKRHQRISFINDYLKSGQSYIEIPLYINVSGVSHDYGTNTRSIISSMPLDSILTLKFWPAAPDADHQICVFDKNNHQIGYIPDNSTDPFWAEFEKQIKAGVPFEATLSEKGIVQDTDIWWCRVGFILNAPYPKDSPTVYISNFGGSYHCRNGCCRADWEVPTFWTEQYSMKPCKQCHKDA